MRVILTGAAGYIGSPVLTKLQARTDIDFIKQVDVSTITTSAEWDALVQTDSIDTIFYIESIENDNICVPNNTVSNTYQLNDFLFIEFLQNRDINVQGDLNILYMSTDRVYYEDSFPNEIHPIQINTTTDYFEPVPFSREDRQYFYSYAAGKALSETKLNVVPKVILRIIRPFAITGPNRHQDCPLVSMIQLAISDEELPVFEEGVQGVTFTHIDDLTSIIVDQALFDPVVQNTLTSKIINFSRVQNYLSVYQLAEKIVNKTESNSHINLSSGPNIFSEVQKTPQIRNMVRIYQPTIFIEMIIEEIANALGAINVYDPLVIGAVNITATGIEINGQADSESVCAFYFGNGENANADTDTSGNFILNYTFNYPIDIYPIEIKVTTDNNVQYTSAVLTL